jgi:hypothetical protein
MRAAMPVAAMGPETTNAANNGSTTAYRRSERRSTCGRRVRSTAARPADGVPGTEADQPVMQHKRTLVYPSSGLMTHCRNTYVVYAAGPTPQPAPWHGPVGVRTAGEIPAEPSPGRRERWCRRLEYGSSITMAAWR